jgi:hypothetical protein
MNMNGKIAPFPNLSSAGSELAVTLARDLSHDVIALAIVIGSSRSRKACPHPRPRNSHRADHASGNKLRPQAQTCTQCSGGSGNVS